MKKLPRTASPPGPDRIQPGEGAPLEQRRALGHDSTRLDAPATIDREIEPANLEITDFCPRVLRQQGETAQECSNNGQEEGTATSASPSAGG